MTKNETILKTSTVEIKGKLTNVETVKGMNKQDIYYRVNGSTLSSEDFWKRKPVFLN